MRLKCDSSPSRSLELPSLCAKQSVWWPGLSAQLQQKVEKCDICESHRKNFKETLIPTQFPERPWTKVGADLIQWKDDQYLLVIRDGLMHGPTGHVPWALDQGGPA